MASIKKPACFSANKKACFSVLFPFAGGEASSVPISLFYSSGFLERGSEATGLPAAGAAFRPQEIERVNQNKRRRTAAPVEAAEGAVKKHVSSSEEAEITVRSMVFFASLS